MDTTMFKTIPLETAIEYHTFAAERGRAAGKIEEQKRIVELLKSKGMYEAVLLIKKEMHNGKLS
jgi:hypothetical protein